MCGGHVTPGAKARIHADFGEILASQKEFKAALARPEVASALVTDRALLELDLTELTYG